MPTHQTAEPAGPVLPAGFVPQVASAPGTEPGKVRPLDRLVTLIGSRRDCDLSILHNDISKVHCALIHTGRGLAVADLCSRAGTFLNDERVMAAAIKPGDRLRLGSIEVQLAWGADEAEGGGLELDPPLCVELNGNSYELTEVPAIIGRRASSQIQVDTPDVSLAHTIVFAYNGRPAVFDPGSRSGTILNDARVELSWLRDGDVLTIGGETLEIGWAGLVEEDVLLEADADPNADTHLTRIVPVEEPVPVADPGDLGGLLQVINSNIQVLHKTVENRAGELLIREKEVEQLQERLDAELEQIESQQEQLTGQADALQTRMADLLSREEAVGKQEASVEKRTASLDRTRTKLRAATAKLRTERQQVEKQQHELDAALNELQKRELELTRQASRVREEQMGLEARQLRLDSLEKELQAREAAVVSKEDQSKAAEDRMEAFQKALAEASEVFNPPADSSSDGPGADEEEAAAPVEEEPPKVASRPRRSGALPGPIVDQPIFAAEASEAAEAEPPKRKRRWWS